MNGNSHATRFPCKTAVLAVVSTQIHRVSGIAAGSPATDRYNRRSASTLTSSVFGTPALNAA